MPTVSIIVPVYNVEQHLHRCIISILTQTFKDFELILINDGSQDNSSDICDYYTKSDSRVIVVHQSNHGVSFARNKGLELATGKYVVFCDSDDYILQDYLEQLLVYSADLVICGTNIKYDHEEEFKQRVPNEALYTAPSIQDISFLYKSLLLYSPYSKLFNNNIIKESNIQFHTNITWGEDGMFVSDYIKNIKTIQTIEYSGYNHLIYTSDNTLSTKVRVDIVEMITKSRTYCINHYKSYVNFPILYNVIETDIKNNCAYFVDKLIHSDTTSIYTKYKILKVFIRNEFVQKTIKDADLYYSLPECFKTNKASKIINSYCLFRVKSKLYQLYSKLPSLFKFVFKISKRIFKNEHS